jgi:processive 1,2-diacylglycerol beta-glucosyltransferase
MQPRHIVVLSVSAGAGHVRAAQALCAAAESEFPGLRVTHIDVMDLVSDGFRALYADAYLRLVEKAPLLWAYLYQQTDRRSSRSSFARLRRAVERLNTQKLERELARQAPDAIVCTHFLPAELLSRRIARGRETPPVWVQVTDFDVHGLWIHPHLAGYFAASDEVAWRLAARGIAAEDVLVTGIPIMPQFSSAPTRAEAARELGLDPERTTLLMMSGGAGVGAIDLLAEKLVGLPHDLQIVALAGRNEALLAALQELAARHPGRLHPMGFTRTIERVMACADIAITKPGGLTTSECLAMSLPMILVSPIPGQEERNADFLLESGAALKATDAVVLEYKLRLLLGEPERLTRMRERMRALARPAAARHVLERVLRGPAERVSCGPRGGA